MVETLTDNKNRTAADMRKLFENHGGNLGGAGCVAFMFQRKGVLTFPVAAAGEDQMMNDALEAGAENMETDGDLYVITAPPAEFESVKKALTKKYKPASSDIAMVPKDWIKLDDEGGRKIMNLMEALDDNEDVQKVYMNADLPDSLIGK